MATPRAEHQSLPPNSPSTWRLRGLLAAGVLIVTLLYFPLNHSVAGQHVLTTGLDDHLPLIPLFALPYLTFLPVFWLTVIYAFITGRGFTRLAVAIILTYFVSNVVYLLFHTYMPRPEHVSGVASGLVHFVYSHDHPYNDFPSEHASSATLLALYAWTNSKRWGLTAVVFAAVVVAATVLIRQHSLAGASSGILLAIGSWYLAVRLVVPQLTRLKPGVEQQRLHHNR
jgi:hypothetical protein